MRELHLLFLRFPVRWMLFCRWSPGWTVRWIGSSQPALAVARSPGCEVLG
jgi:hypothetical protein